MGPALESITCVFGRSTLGSVLYLKTLKVYFVNENRTQSILFLNPVDGVGRYFLQRVHYSMPMFSVTPANSRSPLVLCLRCMYCPPLSHSGAIFSVTRELKMKVLVFKSPLVYLVMAQVLE